MRITKYKHACFTLEIDEQVLVVDPGGFTTDFVVPNGVVAIVVTHEHGDHFDPEMLAKIYDKNPDAMFVSLPEITDKMSNHKYQAVMPGDKITVGLFNLEFFGGKHAVIHPSIPTIDNIGVMVNNSLYYPGDSFDMPGRSVRVLALPVGAPWLKISEAMDFLTALKPELVFPTHDAVLSDIGKQLADGRLSTTANEYGGKYQRIATTPINI